MLESHHITRAGAPTSTLTNEQGSFRATGRDFNGGRKKTRLRAIAGERRIYKDEFLCVSTLSRKKFKRYAGQFLASMGCSSGLSFR